MDERELALPHVPRATTPGAGVIEGDDRRGRDFLAEYRRLDAAWFASITRPDFVEDPWGPGRPLSFAPGEE